MTLPKLHSNNLVSNGDREFEIVGDRARELHVVAPGVVVGALRRVAREAEAAAVVEDGVLGEAVAVQLHLHLLRRV